MVDWCYASVLGCSRAPIRNLLTSGSTPAIKTKVLSGLFPGFQFELQPEFLPGFLPGFRFEILPELLIRLLCGSQAWITVFGTLPVILLDLSCASLGGLFPGPNAWGCVLGLLPEPMGPRPHVGVLVWELRSSTIGGGFCYASVLVQCKQLQRWEHFISFLFRSVLRAKNKKFICKRLSHQHFISLRSPPSLLHLN